MPTRTQSYSLNSKMSGHEVQGMTKMLSLIQELRCAVKASYKF